MSTLDPPKILVVDDDPSILDTLCQGLQRNGFIVDTSPDGEAAMQRVAQGDLALVIADIRMTGVSGLALLENLQKQGSRMPVLLMTGQGSVSGAVEAMRKGASDYLLKPFSFDVLDHAIRRALSRSNSERTPEGVPEVSSAGFSREFVTQNRDLLETLETAGKLAHSNATVLILGDSGTGKECLARFIHNHSLQPDAPYIAVNCAALPESLAESELFGYEKGAFTGALSRKPGKFELAQSGTLVLDEISEMPLSLQAKLLRVLQEREIDRVGGGTPIPLKARIIAVSNVDLETSVREGRFRQDLYYRINVVPLILPPLSKRKEDIPVLVDCFLKKYSKRYGKSMLSADAEALETLAGCPWPGNVRELENTVERAVLLHDDSRLQTEHLRAETSASPANGASAIQAGVSVREMEKQLIMTTLEEVNQNRARAAEMLGISIRTLRNKLKEYRENQKRPVEQT